jgi:SET domain-containing protein
LNIWRIKTVIKKSSIHGQGRFALENCPMGSLVLIINGPVKTRKEAPKKFPITDELNIDCEDTHINHSTSNNLDLNGQIFFIANRDIKAGEELTMNYQQFASGKYLFD